MTQRTIENSLKELENLKKEAEEISDFLNGKELSPDEYKKQYEEIEKKLTEIRKRVNEIKDYLNQEAENGNLSQNQIQTINELLNSFRNLIQGFESLTKPDDFEKKFKENQPINLGNLTPKSTFSDIPLNPEELAKLKPKRLLARTDGGIEYYEIDFDGQTTILRYNSKDPGDEIALYTNVSLEGASIGDIKRLIINAERRGFRDVEMDGTASVTNIGMIASGAVAGATTGLARLKSAPKIGGAISGLSKLSLASKLPTGVLSAISGTGKRIAAIGGGIRSVKGALIIGTGVVIGGVVASMTDLDYTSGDYKMDFGEELENIRRGLTAMNYKT